MRKVIVLTSGGMDSTTLLYQHVRLGDELRAIAFNYGQRHQKELTFAKINAEKAKVPLTVVDLHSLRDVLPGSSQTDDNVGVPEGHYSEDLMKLTVVPNRNMILLAIAVGHAIAYDAGFVSYAAHAGDHAVYPDCRPEFTKSLQGAISKCDWRKVRLLRPFIKIPKSNIVRLGTQIGVDWTQTWSCYVGAEVHCGRCGTCIERREAFHLTGIPDPTIYGPSAPAVEMMVANNWKL